MQQHLTAVAREHDDQIHHRQHEVVVPYESPLAPESGVPTENLPLDRSQPDHNQTERRLTRQHGADLTLQNQVQVWTPEPDFRCKDGNHTAV